MLCVLAAAHHCSAPPLGFILCCCCSDSIHPPAMSSVQLCGAAVGAATSVQPLRVPTSAAVGVRPTRRASHGLVVRAATVVAPKYTTVKPLADRVLLKTKTAELKTTGGILLPTASQSKPQSGEVVAIGEGRIIGDSKVEVSIQVGAQVVYSKYAGTEVELNDSNHLILKEDDIIGILETDDAKDMKPLSDRVLIKVAVAEDKTAGGLLLTDSVKEKPSIGTVVAVGPGHLDEQGKRIPLPVSEGSSVLYSKYAGAEFKGADGTNYIVLRVSDLMAVLS